MTHQTTSPEWIDAGGFNGESACSYVPAAHQGPCAISYFSRGQQHWAIFPSRDEATTAAAGACRWDVGGYDNVTIHPVSAVGEAAEQYERATEWLFGDDDVWEGSLQQTGVAGLLRRTMREVAQRIAANPRELAAIEWRDLERVLFEVFDALGYRAYLTRPAKDGAYDLRLEAEGYIYFVEVKHWSQPSRVGTGFINRFTEIVIENAGEGLLILTSGFTDKVVKGRLEISSYPVVLGTALKVISLCRHYVESESGLWVREGGLRDIFFEGAF